MRGRIKDLTFSVTGSQILSIEVAGDARPIYDELRDAEIEINIKKYRPKRSLDANAYMWVMVGKIAEKVKLSPQEVYREFIRDVGGNYTVLPIRNDALEDWKKIWEHNGIGWICEELGESKIEGYTNTRNFHGSSTYDTAQMARLIDLVVEDCESLGIETKTPDEIARMKSLWTA